MKPAARRLLTCCTGPVMAMTLLAGPAAASAEPYWLNVSARFLPPTSLVESPALTYDVDKVPATSRITVSALAGMDQLTVRLSVAGLPPDRTYGAHVHTRPCGYAPESSGPHYQHRPDPVQPSTDPAYANPDNEVWLDLTTDGTGRGTSFARQEWRFRPGQARSVVLHDRHTSTEPGHAGQAGPRLACFTVPFR